MPKALFTLMALGVAAIRIASGLWLPWGLIAAAAVASAVWLFATPAGRRTASITAAGLATLPQRLGGASVALIGIAGVVGVLIALLAMGNGLQATLQATGSDDTAIVLSVDAPGEIGSTLDQNSVTLIGSEPQVMRDAKGRPIASPELLTIVSLPNESSGFTDQVSLRGVGPEVWALRPNVKIVAGRRFRTGLKELIVGKDAAREFGQTSIGSTLDLDGEPWKVVGEFDSGDAHDSELWADTGVVATTFHRGNSANVVSVRLGRARQFDAFKAALSSNPQLTVEAHTTRAFYAQQAKGLTRLIRVVGSIIAAIMAIGAVAGALNSMYSAVAARTREIATLRAIGFRGSSVVVSVMIETLLLALAGGALGAATAWLLFDHYTASTMGSNYNEMVFQLRVSPALLGTGLLVALVIGILGGLFPALSAARMPVADALRKF
jgi:putative ABC transport system permease protein